MTRQINNPEKLIELYETLKLLDSLKIDISHFITLCGIEDIINVIHLYDISKFRNETYIKLFNFIINSNDEYLIPFLHKINYHRLTGEMHVQILRAILNRRYINNSNIDTSDKKYKYFKCFIESSFKCISDTYIKNKIPDRIRTKIDECLPLYFVELNNYNKLEYYTFITEIYNNIKSK